MDTYIDKWHQHLDTCQRCEQHPFDLCHVGLLLFRQAGKEALSTLKQVNLDAKQAR